MSANPDDVIYDVVGVGFGPSNLALAIAIYEHNRENCSTAFLRAGFLERQEKFAWHSGMLMDGARMQVSFMKDLVTLRRPTSEFTFVNYLHQRGRLLDFINHKTMHPLRLEFHDYLEWAAARFSDIITYRAEVIDIVPVSIDERVAYLDVIAQRAGGLGGKLSVRTRNLVIGTGLTPSVPPGTRLSQRIWHSSELLDRLGVLPAKSARRFVVVGAGQSAAEVADYLHDRFKNAEVHAVFSRYGYSPADDSPFVNQIFDPIAVDTFYYSPYAIRKSLLEYHAGTNYSVVDADLIERLYEKSYAEKISEAKRLFLHRMSKVVECDTAGDVVEVTVEDLAINAKTKISADALIYATGYRQTDPLRALGSAAELCEQGGEGAVRIERDYRIATSGDVTCGIYLQGGTEHSHGISSPLLSNVAIRAGEIVASLLGTKS